MHGQQNIKLILYYPLRENAILFLFTEIYVANNLPSVLYRSIVARMKLARSAGTCNEK